MIHLAVHLCDTFSADFEPLFDFFSSFRPQSSSAVEHTHYKHVQPKSPSLRPARCSRSPCCKYNSQLIEAPGKAISLTRACSHPSQEERDLPTPAADEVQIAVQATGLCGSDLHYFNHFRNGDILVREPLTLGHESSGTVVAAGSAVKDLVPGDRVALEVGLPCENCEYCTSGRYNICRGIKFRSSAKAFPHAQGTLQERVNHPARWCHK